MSNQLIDIYAYRTSVGFEHSVCHELLMTRILIKINVATEEGNS